jgi:modulator of FtsH protease HflK
MAWNPYENQPDGQSGGKGGGFEELPFELPKNIIALALYGIVALLILLGVRGSFYTVGPEEVGVVLRFGVLHSVAPPGFHLKMPFEVDAVHKVATETVHKEEFGFRTQRAGTRTQYSAARFDDESLMLTGDLNVADVEWVVQYKVRDPATFFFNLSEPEQTVRDVAESVLRQVVGNRTVDGVLTTGRSRIETRTREGMQRLLDEYKAGIRVTIVQLQNVTPPGPVQASFNDVNRAEQDSEKLENEALAQFNNEIPKAKGEAKRAIDRAEGYKVDRVNRAKGNVARFVGILEEYRKAPEVTRTRLYLEQLNKVLPSTAEITVIDAGVRGVLPHLALSKGGAR